MLAGSPGEIDDLQRRPDAAKATNEAKASEDAARQHEAAAAREEEQRVLHADTVAFSSGFPTRRQFKSRAGRGGRSGGAFPRTPLSQGGHDAPPVPCSLCTLTVLLRRRWPSTRRPPRASA